MPCSSNGNAPLQQPQPGTGLTVLDLLELHPFTPRREFLPATKAELVNAVARSTAERKESHALGSNWSLSLAGESADDVINTCRLSRHLAQPFPAVLASSPLAHDRARGGGHTVFDSWVPQDGGRHFIHVEAGIKFKDLLVDLKACRLALPTMGAGGGQSLAGALSTGTHGADFHVPPLVEWIRAVHLVGPGGQEWWITPAQSLFARDEVRRLPGWCPDARIVAHDDAFAAVRVAAGRMGVIYALVLEVVPAYVLVEANLPTTWHSIHNQLAHSRVKTWGGVFNADLEVVNEGWFSQNVVDTMPGITGGSVPVGAKGKNPAGIKRPLSDAQSRELTVQVDALKLAMLDIRDLAEDLSGLAPVQLRHVNIAMNLSRTEQCWITRRWAVPATVRDSHLGPVKREPIEQALIDHPRQPLELIGPIIQEFTKDLDFLDLAGATLLYGGEEIGGHGGQVTELLHLLQVQIPQVAYECATAGATSGEALFLILYRILSNPSLPTRIHDAVLDAITSIVGADFKKRVRAGHASDVLDTHNYDFDGAQSGNSAEFHFDASASDYLTFADRVVSLAGEHYPVLGYLGIRFTPGSSALIAMQQFDLTASVEVATGRVRTEDVYHDFWTSLHNAAEQLNGIPHWGEESRQSKAALAGHYGQRLTRWQAMLAELSTDGPRVFSNDFSRSSGLEPSTPTGLFLGEPLSMYRDTLEACSD